MHNGIAMKQRSHRPASPPPAPLAKTVFSSLYGTVRVYTRRHIHGCQLTHPDQQHCSCPKWIYAKARGSKPRQQAASTPSYTEACEVAQKMLKGFDPEIRAARELVAPATGAVTIEGAIENYLAMLAGRKLTDDYTGRIILPVFCRRKPRKDPRPARRILNLSLLDFLDLYNRERATPVIRVEELTSELLERWVARWKTNDLTSKQWRTVANAFFRWALNHGYLQRLPIFDRGQNIKKGNRCGYFSDEEYARLCHALVFHSCARGQKLPEHFAERLGAFMDLGRWAGMAVCDIVRFSPQKHLDANNVLTYQRLKTGGIAQILLAPAVAARLRSIPSEPRCSVEEPLRFTHICDDHCRRVWRERFQRLCEKAGIREIETEVGTRRKPHPHMLRDTFAIDAISRGVDLTNVAKMLGHATVLMTQKSYLFWIKKRLDYCIEDQRAALARVQPAAPVAAAGGVGEVHAVGRPLVH